MPSLKVLEGEHTVVYDIVNPRGVAFIPDYSNESFEQKVISQDEFSKRVQVTSRMSPMKTRVPLSGPSTDAVRFGFPVPLGGTGPAVRRSIDHPAGRRYHQGEPLCA